jgi:hypothetical protein
MTTYFIIGYFVLAYCMWCAIPEGWLPPTQWVQFRLSLLWPITLIIAIFSKILN